MTTRSKAYKKIFDDFSPPTCDLANRILDALESAGVEFAPEETSAVEKWEEAKAEWKDCHTDMRANFLIIAGNSMRDELQARIAALEKRIEEKDAEIDRLTKENTQYKLSTRADINKAAQPLPESPELVKAKEEFREMRARFSQSQCTDWSMANKSMIYIAALESELARLRGGK